MAASSEEKVSLRTWTAVLGTVLGAFMAVLDIQITNASLREITGGIGSTAVEASWVSTSYLIGEIITIPLTAWLGRVFGVRLYLLVNVSLFLVFSGLCGTASELTQMIIYRALQASVQTNSFVMAYNECFLALGVILLLGSVSIWLCKKTKAAGAAAAH